MTAATPSFADIHIDPRLQRALLKQGFVTPTHVQQHAIPKLLQGSDIVACAHTGSGKTLAYLLPALHNILTNTLGRAGWQALILVPTRELVQQVTDEATHLASHIDGDLRITALASTTQPSTAALQRAAVSTAGQVVVATPGRVAQALHDGSLTARVLSTRLHTLVLDEADLLMSYGYEEDIAALAPLVPRACQCILVSATTNEDMQRLTKLVLHNPTMLDLRGVGGGAQGGGEEHKGGPAIVHHAVECVAGDRLLVLMAMLKLGLVRKRVLIFVNTINEAFRVRLFLEAFGLKAALLNAELPINSRQHILQSFNKGMFDYLIATDEGNDVSGEEGSVGKNAGKEDGSMGKNTLEKDMGEEEKGEDDTVVLLKKKKNKEESGGQGGKGGGKKRKADVAFGVTRGVDFKGVCTVINYQAPATIAGYTHRVGRTGRAGKSGIAVSLFTPNDAHIRAAIDAHLVATQPTTTSKNTTNNPATSTTAKNTTSAAQGGTATAQQGRNGVFTPLPRLTKAAVESLRYRAEDVARSITKLAIKEARAKDLRQELLNSERLAEHFASNPTELKMLQHTTPLGTLQAPSHLKHVPAYLRDPAAGSGRRSFGGRGRGVLSRKKAKTLAAGRDPVKGFVKAPKKGGDGDEAPTDMEIRAAEIAKKDAKKAAKKEGKVLIHKQNVRRNVGRKR